MQDLASREALFIFLFLFLNVILLPVCYDDSKEYLGQAKISRPRLWLTFINNGSITSTPHLSHSYRIFISEPAVGFDNKKGNEKIIPEPPLEHACRKRTAARSNGTEKLQLLPITIDGKISSPGRKVIIYFSSHVRALGTGSWSGASVIAR